MNTIYDTSEAAGQAAAVEAATLLRNAIRSKGKARIVAATGAAQFHFLKALTAAPGIDWKKVEMFHLDEYAGLPATHPASFRKFLLERLIQPTGMERYHLLDGEGDLAAVCRDTGTALNTAPIDVAFVGIGENGHLAFNDPPADFTTEEPFIVVKLDEACRLQQVSEGWFPDLSKVPQQALSMSIRQVLKAQKILCIVTDERKAKAIKACLQGEISPNAPASILRTHPDVKFYLDRAATSLLDPRKAPLA